MYHSNADELHGFDLGCRRFQEPLQRRRHWVDNGNWAVLRYCAGIARSCWATTGQWIWWASRGGMNLEKLLMWLFNENAERAELGSNCLNCPGRGRKASALIIWGYVRWRPKWGKRHRCNPRCGGALRLECRTLAREFSKCAGAFCRVAQFRRGVYLCCSVRPLVQTSAAPDSGPNGISGTTEAQLHFAHSPSKEQPRLRRCFAQVTNLPPISAAAENGCISRTVLCLGAENYAWADLAPIGNVRQAESTSNCAICRCSAIPLRSIRAETRRVAPSSDFTFAPAARNIVWQHGLRTMASASAAIKCIGQLHCRWFGQRMEKCHMWQYQCFVLQFYCTQRQEYDIMRMIFVIPDIGVILP